MKKYNVKCPFCGKVNRNLYLADSKGLMECESCHQIVKVTPDAVLHPGK